MPPNFPIAQAVASTEPPPIPKAQAWGREYLSHLPSPPNETNSLLDLSQGVPNAPPHPSLLKAISHTSADPSAAKYGLNLGEEGLRSALADEICHQYHLTSEGVNGKDVAITTGCNMAFLALLMTICPPNTSSVLLPLPAYFNLSMSMSLLSVKPVYIPCDEKTFSPSISAARKALSTRVSGTGPIPRMIVLITPNNPTGAVYSPAKLEEWYDLAKEYKVALVIDETYRDFVEGEGEGGERGWPHRLFERSDWRDNLISLGSFSKAYRIPGHRLGSIIASPELLTNITTVGDCMQICAPRPPQLALYPLLPSLRPDILKASQTLAHRRHLFVETVTSIPGWSISSIGGFFAYVSFPDHYLTASSVLGLKRKRLGSEDIAKVLALRCGVVTLPGSYFMPPLGDDEAWEKIEGGETMREDRWLRFAVANVEDEVVIKLGPRLRQMNELMGME